MMSTERARKKYENAEAAMAAIHATRCNLCRSWLDTKYSMAALCSAQIQSELSRLRPKHRMVRVHVHTSKLTHLNVIADLIFYSPGTKHWYIRTKKIGTIIT